MIAGVILAGGRATRMGGVDKPLLQVGGRPILAHAAERLAPQVNRLALNANGDPARFRAFGLPVLPDRLPEGVPALPGPLAGLLAALDWAAPLGAEAVVTVAGDAPFFPRRLVVALEAAAEADGRPLVLAFSAGADGGLQHHPVFGRWPVALRDPLRTALLRGTRRVMDFAEACGYGRAVFPEPAAFRNANTPADLAVLEATVAP